MSYATTPTLSLDAPQCSVSSVSPMSVQLGWPGLVGGSVSAGAPTVSLSTLGPPLAVVAVTRTVLLPALKVALIVSVAQVDQAPVPVNSCAAETTVPFTAMSIGRLVVVPLAYRMVRLASPACATPTVNWM